MKLGPPISFTLTILAISFLALPALGQKTEHSQSKFAQTIQGTLGSSFIDAVNTGELVLHQNFVASRFSESTLKNTPVEAWLDLLQKLRKQSGGLEVVNASPEGESVLNIIVRSRQGNHWAR